MARARTDRLSFAKIPEVHDLPNLLAVQHDSFSWFLDHGLKQIFGEVSPIEDFTGNLALELTDHRFGDATALHCRGKRARLQLLKAVVRYRPLPQPRNR